MKIMYKKKAKEIKKYKYKIYFKNNQINEGWLTATDLNQVYDILMTNNFQHLEQDKKAMYWNVNEFNFVEVYLVETKEEAND